MGITPSQIHTPGSLDRQTEFANVEDRSHSNVSDIVQTGTYS